MITLSNGHSFEYVVASGALAYDGYGWPWERPLVWMGRIKPHLFTVVTKSLTRLPRPGNLRWWKPWECVRFWQRDSVVNKVGLTNPGVEWWCRTIGPTVDRSKLPLVGSIFGSRDELVEMARMLDRYDLVGIEVNASCPNTGHPINDVLTVVDDVCAVREHTVHPVIVKVSVAQDYCAIAERLEGIAEAISFNSVPWETVYPPDRIGTKSPLWKLQERVQGGGGGISGKLAQKHNWLAVNQLAIQVHAMDIIAPSIMEYDDLEKVRALGARAYSFGAIHIRTPWKPTQIVKRHMSEGWPGVRDPLLQSL